MNITADEFCKRLEALERVAWGAPRGTTYATYDLRLKNLAVWFFIRQEETRGAKMVRDALLEMRTNNNLIFK